MQSFFYLTKLLHCLSRRTEWKNPFNLFYTVDRKKPKINIPNFLSLPFRFLLVLCYFNLHVGKNGNENKLFDFFKYEKMCYCVAVSRREC